ncbi:glycosyltransferase family 2 protein [Flavobacterium gyeonganense]|uniref:Glycosyltransferase family 2 protein n=1 Tax=Flavobacterium gyeonganense TaxID=1310418 RepID=A0ABV5H803_9FLAO
MIIIYHHNNKLISVTKDGIEIPFESPNISKTLFILAEKFSSEWLIWCHIELKEYLNTTSFEKIFHHNKIMASFTVNKLKDYLPESIGYIEESVFLKVNRKVSYPTWLMSSDAGGIHASVLLKFINKIKVNQNFNYFLNSVAKNGYLKGLLCYSEPKLILDNEITISVQQASIFDLFKFVKQHYRTRWTFILFLNFLFFEKRLTIIPLFLSVRFKNLKKIGIDLSEILVQSKLKVIDKKTIDVIIPTIGRKKYLYDVLKDLAKQTHLPKNVIIVEQNPIEESVSELDYVSKEEWPFLIKHIFTHQAGACNARNLALSQVTSEWVFLNDDDNRFDSNLLNDIFCKIEQYGVFAATTSYIQKNEKLVFKTIHQSGIFGSGNSFVKSSCLKNVSFSMALEFGYGEDSDFGLQLRHEGFDIIYFPEPAIIHLKAPFGGFRIKPKFEWDNEIYQPKPSPTIMYVKQKYMTQKQIKGYKFILFFKIMKKQSFFKWNSIYKFLNEKWNVSLKWSEKLENF